MTITTLDVAIDIHKDDMEIKVNSNVNLLAMKAKSGLADVEILPSIFIDIVELPCYGQNINLVLSKAQAEILMKALQEKLNNWDKNYQHFLELVVNNDD